MFTLCSERKSLSRWRRIGDHRTRTSAVALALSLVAFAANAQAQVKTIQSVGSGSWLSSGTWLRTSSTGGPKPEAGDEVTIQAGHNVVLDTNIGIQDLSRLIVNGTFRVADTQTYNMGVSRVDVGLGGSGAVFQIGTTTAPFQNKFELTLTDRFLVPQWGSGAEHKTFIVFGGATVSMIGRSTNAAGLAKPSWLRIKNNNNLAAGTKVVFLESAPNFDVGDQLVIASTDFDLDQFDLGTVQAIAGDKVTLASNVTWNHHGTIENGVDERAEVGLLTRNIVVRTDPTTLAQRRGGHMLFTGSPAPLIQLERIECRDLGWHGARGRYPIHFHMMGNSPAGSFVRGCSINRSFNRALTVHLTNNVLVEDNVAFDHWGHGYYLEFGTEILNTFTRNLGIRTRTPSPAWTGIPNFKLGDNWPVTGQPFFHEEDSEPATFWITNSDNTFTANVAAGSEAHGFWWKLSPVFIPISAALPIIPPRFQNNVAHSNRIHGFFQENHTVAPVNFAQQFPFETSGNLSGLTSYKNRKAGIWFRAVSEFHWQNCKLADNGFAVYLASHGVLADFPEYLKPYITPVQQPGVRFYNFATTNAPGFSVQSLENCLIVGETNNFGNPKTVDELNWSPQPRSLPDPAAPELMVKGVELYDGLIVMAGCRFENFKDVQMPFQVTAPGGTFTHRVSAAISSRGEHSRLVPGNGWGVDPRNAIMLSTFVNVDHKVLFPIPHAPIVAGGIPFGPDGVASAVLYDIDGSLGAGADTYYANYTPLMRPATGPVPPYLPNHPSYANPMVLPRTAGPNGDFRIGQMAITFLGDCSGPYGCLSTWNQNPPFRMATVPNITVTSVTRPNTSMNLHHALLGVQPYIRWFQGNILFDHNGVQEHYSISYPNANVPNFDPNCLPRDFEIDLRFCDAGRGAIFDFPYVGTPPTAVRFISKAVATSGFPFTSTTHTTLPSFLSATGNAVFHDSAAGKLYIRAVLPGNHQTWMNSGLLPILSGREISIEVDD